MAYTRRIKVKGKKYWVLEHTIRKGKKYQKKIKYIGKTLPSKTKLEKLKEEFLKDINKNKYKFLTAEDIKKIENKKKKYNKDLKKITKLEKEERLKEFIIRFTYDSSKLAGVPVTLRQTYLILKQGIMPKNIKNLRTVKELENHEKGFMVITKYRGKLNLKFIKKLHKILLTDVNNSIAGKLRNELKRDVKVAGTPYIPPKWKTLKKELNNFFKWYDSEKRKLHPIELAALVHLKMISIQPFIDGNSRLSRLLMNWVLWKKNYPLVDIPIEDIEKYYNVLDKYQIEKKERPFIRYIKKKYLEGV